MCGICGYITSSTDLYNKDYINSMVCSLEHRGFDGQGHYFDEGNNLALGHTRLKVIDLSDKAKQPMVSADLSIILSYNGEIYNYKQLRDILKARGYQFRSDSDTEVLLYAYQEYGREFINRLNGDFAFAIWDKNKKELLLYRDRVGVKPLYYSFFKGIFSFASEIKALFEMPHINRKIDEARLKEYLGHLYVFGENTLFENIQELQPGEFIVYKEGHIEKNKYFDFSFDEQIRNLSYQEQKEEFLKLFDDAVKIRLYSDVPVGVYLSGGIDSSFMTARMRGSIDADIYTYTLGFDKEEYNEFKYSQIASQKCKTLHTEYVIDNVDYFEVLKKVIWHYDEPLPHLVSIPQYYLAREAKKDITVALAGTGGDELFAGYDHYLYAQKLLAGNLKSSDKEVASYQKSLRPEVIASEFKSCSQKNIVDKMIKYSGDYRKNLAKYYEENNYPDFISKMLYFDFKTHVVAMMNKDDKMNMAWGIEGRYPYMDYRVVQFALSMSPELKIKDGIGKWVLKDLSTKYFGNDFVYRTKQAFPTPVEKWFAENNDLLNFNVLRDRYSSVLDFTFIDSLVFEHLEGSAKHTRRLWGLLGLDKLMENCA